MKHKIRLPKGAKLKDAKRIYTPAEFVRSITDSELKKFVGGRKTNDDMGVMFERVKVTGLNFNMPEDLAQINAMQGAGVFTKERRDELVG